MLKNVRRFWWLLLGLIVVLAVVLVALFVLNGDEDEKTLTPVSIQFSWVHAIEFAGFYAAEEQGYYRDAGLQVTLNGGGFDENGYINPIQRVVDGESMFGVTDAGGLLQARAQGLPLVAIGTIYQRSPIVLLSLAETGITKPEDLKGKRIYTDQTNVAVPYKAFLTSQNITSEDITELPKTDFTLNPLINGEIDAMVCFITNEVVQARALGYDVNVLVLSDYGVEIYANVIFTTEDLIKNNPKLVEQFLRATLKGTQWAVDDTKAAADLVLKVYGADMPQELRDVQVPGMEVSGPLLRPAGLQPGMMLPEVWDYTYETLQAQGVLTEPLDVNAAYTLEFLNKIYG